MYIEPQKAQSEIRKILSKWALDNLNCVDLERREFSINNTEVAEALNDIESISSKILGEFPDCVEGFRSLPPDKRYNYVKNRYILLTLLSLNLESETVEPSDSTYIELCKVERLMTETLYPKTYMLFSIVDGEYGRFSKKHSYHIHLLDRIKGKKKSRGTKKNRTDVILLYNKNNLTDSQLYWEKHGRRGSQVDPSTLSKNKIGKIYKECHQFRKKQAEFRTLSPKSNRL